MVKYNVQNLLGSHQVSATISVSHDNQIIFTVFAIRLLVIIMYYSLKESNLGKKFLASSTMHDLCTVFNMDKKYEERKVVVISVFW